MAGTEIMMALNSPKLCTFWRQKVDPGYTLSEETKKTWNWNSSGSQARTGENVYFGSGNNNFCRNSGHLGGRGGCDETENYKIASLSEKSKLPFKTCNLKPRGLSELWGLFWDIPTLLFSHTLVIWGHGLKGGKEAKSINHVHRSAPSRWRNQGKPIKGKRNSNPGRKINQ